jgi:hypothetical protein
MIALLVKTTDFDDANRVVWTWRPVFTWDDTPENFDEAWSILDVLNTNGMACLEWTREPRSTATVVPEEVAA